MSIYGGTESTIGVMGGSHGFRHGIGAVSQPIGLSNAIHATDQGSNSAARSISDGELSTCKSHTVLGVGLDDSDPTGNGDVGGTLLGHNIRHNIGGQFNQFTSITIRQSMLPDRVLTTGQAGRNCNAICIGRHTANISPIGIIDVKLHSSNGLAVGSIRFRQPDATLHGCILHVNGVRLAMLSCIDDRAGFAVNVASRSLYLRNRIGTIGKPIGLSRSICTRCQRCYNRAIVIGNREHCTR